MPKTYQTARTKIIQKYALCGHMTAYTSVKMAYLYKHAAAFNPCNMVFGVSLYELDTYYSLS